MKIIFATAFIAAVGNAAELPSEVEYDFSFLDNLNFDFNETAEALELQDSNNLGVNVKHLPWFFGGLFQSVIGHSDMHDLNSCLGGIGHLAGEVEGTVKDIGSHSFKAAFKHFLNVINAIPGEFNSCKASKNDMQRMVNWAKRFGSPVSMAEEVAKHLITHSQHIFNEAKRTVHYWNSDDLYQSGSNFGDFLTSVFGGINGVEFVPEEETNNLSADISQMPQFFGGILEAFFNHKEEEDFSSCLGGLTKLSDEFRFSMDSINKHDWKMTFYHFNNLVQAVPEELQHCQTANGDIKKFLNWYKRFGNPTQMASKLAKEIALHPKHFYDDVDETVYLWKQGSYYQSGKYFGDLLVSAFGGINSIEEDKFVMIFDAPTFTQ